MIAEGLIDYLNRFSAFVELVKDGEDGYAVRIVFAHGYYLDMIKEDLKKYGISYEDKTTESNIGKGVKE